MKDNLCEHCRNAGGCNATRWDPPEWWCSKEREEFNNEGYTDSGDECEEYSYYDEYMAYCEEYDARLRGFEKA